jgi:crotonobetainyl-CoA:carnitine CoA-transferase CaiB-like acyl-CoA transferase
MVPKYDVFVENYGPGVVEKLDIGYEQLKAVHSTSAPAISNAWRPRGPSRSTGPRRIEPSRDI